MPHGGGALPHVDYGGNARKNVPKRDESPQLTMENRRKWTNSQLGDFRSFCGFDHPSSLGRLGVFPKSQHR